MENVKQILEKLGIELDAGKADELEKSVLANYRTVGEVDGKNARIKELETQLASASEALKAAQSSDAGNSETIDQLKKQLEEFQAEDQKRKEQEQEVANRTAFEEKFDRAVGDRKFANQLVRGVVLDKAYAMTTANPDMDLPAIIAGIIGDEGGVWENPQQDVKKMPGSGDSGSSSSTTPIQNLEDVRKMSVDEVRAHRDEIDKLLAQQK